MLWLIETARGSNPASLTVDKYKKQGTSNISLNTNFHLFNSPPEKFKKKAPNRKSCFHPHKCSINSYVER